MLILWRRNKNVSKLISCLYRQVRNKSSMSSKDVLPRAAVIQMSVTSDKAANLASGMRLLEEAKGLGAHVAFLPEAFDFIGESTEQVLKLSEPLDGQTISLYRKKAKELNMALSLGGFHESCGDKIKNTHVFVSADGSIKRVYSKIHLFDVEIPDKVRLKESDYVVSGKDIADPVDSPIGNIGLGICYDLRFPEQSLLLKERGSQILTYPSAFTVTTGKAHWEVLLRSRAIECQCYVIAAAQSGEHNQKRSSYGHSIIIDPWGDILAHIPEGEGVAIAEIDLKKLDKVRNSMPVHNQRRRDLYSLTQSPQAKVIEDDDWTFEFGHVHIPSRCLVLETQGSVVAVNKKPVLPGHLLVIPKRKTAKRVTDLSSTEITDFFYGVQVAQRLTEFHHQTSASTIGIQDGKEAGQTVAHLHAHVLPRKGGDFEKNDDVYDALEKHDKPDKNTGEEPKWRSEDQMADEAQTLREAFLSMIKEASK